MKKNVNKLSRIYKINISMFCMFFLDFISNTENFYFV